MDTPWNGRCIKYSDIKHMVGVTGLTFGIFDTEDKVILKVLDETTVYCIM